MSENVEYIISLKDLNFSKGIDNADRRTKKLEQGIFSLQGTISGLESRIKTGIGGYLTFDFLRDSVTMFDEAQQAGAQLEASLKSTGTAAGLSSEALTKHAEALSKITRFDDDAIIGMEGLLLTFTNIKGTIYEDAVPAILDLSTKMKQDLNSSAVQVGKALNDPIKGVTALQRVGVSFTAEQKEMIKTLVETGRTAEAQRIILNELNVEFGGSAEAAAKVGTGPLVVLQNQFNNVREEIGQLISEGLNELRPILIEVLDKIRVGVRWIAAHRKEIRNVVVVLGSAIAAYKTWNMVSSVAEIVKKTSATLSFVSALTGVGKAQLILNGVTEGFNKILLKNPIGLVLAGVGAFIGYLITHFDEFKASLVGFWEMVKILAKQITAFFKSARGQLTGDVKMQLQGVYELAALQKQVDDKGGYFGYGLAAAQEYYIANKKAETPEPGSNLSSGNIESGNAYTPGAGTASADRVMGARNNTFHIEINNLVQTLNVHAANLKESTGKIADEITKALVTAINDSQTAAGVQ